MEVEELKTVDKGALSDATRIYEVGYLLLPTMKEEDVPAAYGNLKEAVVSLKGEIISDDMPKMIPLAYTMEKVITNVRHKFTSGYFGWIKFAMEPEAVLELKKKLDLDKDLVRFLIIKTVKENTIASRRFVRGDDMGHRRTYTKKDKDAGPAPEINKEEIDKEIDAMIAA